MTDVFNYHNLPEYDQMKVYEIWCEWDMGFRDLYATEELAQKDINEMDWDLMVGRPQEEVENDGLVSIDELEVYQGEF